MASHRHCDAGVDGRRTAGLDLQGRGSAADLPVGHWRNMMEHPYPIPIGTAV